MAGKIKHSVGFDADLMKWIKDEMKRKRFSSVSHAVNYALQQLKDKEESAKK